MNDTGITEFIVNSSRASQPVRSQYTLRMIPAPKMVYSPLSGELLPLAVIIENLHLDTGRKAGVEPHPQYGGVMNACSEVSIAPSHNHDITQRTNNCLRLA